MRTKGEEKKGRRGERKRADAVVLVTTDH